MRYLTKWFRRLDEVVTASDDGPRAFTAGFLILLTATLLLSGVISLIVLGFILNVVLGSLLLSGLLIWLCIWVVKE